MAWRSKLGLRTPRRRMSFRKRLLRWPRTLSNSKWTRPAARGAFRGGLIHPTRWRIADQFRKRTPGLAVGGRRSEETTGTAVVERVADPAGFSLEGIWEEEWKKNLLAVATENVKSRVSPE